MAPRLLAGILRPQEEQMNQARVIGGDAVPAEATLELPRLCFTHRTSRAPAGLRRPFAPLSAEHLKPAHGVEGLAVVDDEGLAPAGGPAHGQDVEAGGVAQEPVLLQEVEG